MHQDGSALCSVSFHECCDEGRWHNSLMGDESCAIYFDSALARVLNRKKNWGASRSLATLWLLHALRSFLWLLAKRSKGSGFSRRTLLLPRLLQFLQPAVMVADACADANRRPRCAPMSVWRRARQQALRLSPTPFESPSSSPRHARSLTVQNSSQTSSQTSTAQNSPRVFQTGQHAAASCLPIKATNQSHSGFQLFPRQKPAARFLFRGGAWMFNPIGN